MKYVKVMVTATMLAVLCVMIFFHVSNIEPKKKTDSEKKMTLVDEMVNKDVSKNYPSTAREVVLYFNNIQKCYYNENPTEEQLKYLADSARVLFDEEYLAANPYEEYYERLKNEINGFRKAKRTINRIVVDKASDIQYVTMNDVRHASMRVVYYMKDSRGESRVEEIYILRKDKDERWKIYSWGTPN